MRRRAFVADETRLTPERRNPGALRPGDRPAVTQGQLAFILVEAHRVRRRRVFDEIRHHQARVIFGARVIAAPGQHRPREPPDTLLEGQPAGAIMLAIRAKLVIGQQQFQVTPRTAFAVAHEPQRPLVRAVGFLETTGDVERESSQRATPPLARRTGLSGVNGLVVPTRLGQVPDALARDPSVVRVHAADGVDLLDEAIPRLRDAFRLVWRRRTVLLVPVAETADLLVAPVGSRAHGECRRVPAAERLESFLGRAQGLDRRGDGWWGHRPHLQHLCERRSGGNHRGEQNRQSNDHRRVYPPRRGNVAGVAPMNDALRTRLTRV